VAFEFFYRQIYILKYAKCSHAKENVKLAPTKKNNFFISARGRGENFKTVSTEARGYNWRNLHHGWDNQSNTQPECRAFASNQPNLLKPHGYCHTLAL
jgi:hypothetical protein